MATLGSLNFGLPTFDQSNPWLVAMQKISAVRAQDLANQNAQVANQFQPQLLQQQLQKAVLGNQKSVAEQPYWGPQAQANVAQTQAQTGYENTESDINRIKIKNPLLLTTGEIPQTAAAINMLRGSGNNALADKLQSQMDAKIQAENVLANYRATEAATAKQRADTARANAQTKGLKLPGVMAGVNTDAGLFNGFNNYVNSLFGVPTEQPAAAQGAQPAQPGSVAASGGVPVAANANVQGAPQPEVPPPSGNTAIDPAKLNDKDFAEHQANAVSQIKSEFGAKYTNRLLSGIALEKYIDDPVVQRGFELMKKYKARLGGGWIKEGLGWSTNDPEYLAMKAARDQFQSTIVGGLTALEGYPSTDKSVQQTKQFYANALKAFNQSPEAAQAYVNSGKNFINAETNSLLSPTSYKLADFVRSKANNPSVSSDSDYVVMLKIDPKTGSQKRVKVHKSQVNEAIKTGRYKNV